MDTKSKNKDDANLTLEVPPNDFEAEQAVLSSMLFDSEGISICSDVLSNEDFYRQAHKLIFKAIIDLYSLNEPVDIVTLKSKLESMNSFEQVGGMEYLLTLNNIVSTSANSLYYAQIVKQKAFRRKLINISKKVQKFSFDNSIEEEQLIDEVEKLFNKAFDETLNKDFTPIKEVLLDAVDRLEKLFINKSKVTGLETGFIDFDIKTAGLQPSDFILIAGRPSMGKTAFALNIAQNVAVKNKITTVIFSLEMSKEQLINRILCIKGEIDSQRLRTGRLDDNDWKKIVEAADIIYDSPIYIDDTSSISISEIRSKCRKLKKENNLGLVVIDYLQLMSSKGRTESRQQEIAEISRSLKNLARELNVPIIALSQLSRAVEQRKPPKPMLSDLRESGAIEQDADLVCFLYREEYYIPETEKKGLAEVIIAKQRNGSVGTIELNWFGQYTKFSNIERQYSDL